ncbi:MAG: hypothetical protein A2X61_06020 [Ignavibacteria bacterium GWB2_35_12]|nr:MAG: hypothetical protein A2X63_07015 [Ignavibacteria bacterium GWA2_35_8]OGU39810.1 MAG: hypothetical protein A2X61_06020 [Ignavibacteria bacterium GWB2_35_12]OGV21440.1 MAG: hypothetical protein A2475_13600 [Ignavibacteria bacterium RIFOXYC2_FULL_35_21]
MENNKISIKSSLNDINEHSGIIILMDAAGTKSKDIKQCIIFLDKFKKNIDLAKKIAESNSDNENYLKIRDFSYIFFQDTIIFSFVFNSPEDILSSLYEIHGIISSFFVFNLIDNIPLRGVMSIGNFIQLNNYSILGEAINEAMEYHEKFDMYGIILHENCNFLLDPLNNPDISFERVIYPHSDVIFKDLFLKYKIPLKDSCGTEKKKIDFLYTLNWIFGLLIALPSDERNYSKIVGNYGYELIERLDKNNNTLNKINNTIAYLDKYFTKYPEIRDLIHPDL